MEIYNQLVNIADDSDDNCFIYHPKGKYHTNDGKDVLGVYAGKEDMCVSVFVSNSNDTEQEFVSLEEIAEIEALKEEILSAK